MYCLAVITSVFTLGVSLTVWLCDACLALVVTRLILDRIGQGVGQSLAAPVRAITDLLVDTVDRQISAWRGRPVPTWVSWAILVLFLMSFRLGFSMLLISMQSAR